MPYTRNHLVRRPPRSRRRGFTLTELLISVAISLALILGIAKVFQLTGDTIGAGTALSSVTRDQRAAQSAFEKDFAGLSTANPGLAIWSGTTRTYLDRATMDADTTVTTTQAGALPFRTDRIAMFVTGKYTRQTGDEGFLASSLTTEQAYVQYGHLVLPNNAGERYYTMASMDDPIVPGSIRPGLGAFAPEQVATNPNNFFARQWILGRSVVLLKQRSPAGTPPGAGRPTNSFIVDPDAPDTDDRQNYYTDVPFATDPDSLAPLLPRNGPIFGTPTDQMTDNLLETSRFDLAGTTDDPFVHFATRLAAAANNTPGNGWWRQLDFRFQADPFPPRPLTAAGAARTAPIFLPGCSDFIVEFAGDYLPVNNEIDFDPVDPDGTGPLPAIRQTRWYGFPRDSDGDNNLTLADVVPLKWRPGAPPPTFERNEGTAIEFDDAPAAYPGTAASPLDPSSFNTTRQYVTAWTAEPATPNTWPKLIRIIYTTRDANGRLQNPQPIETIFKVN